MEELRHKIDDLIAAVNDASDVARTLIAGLLVVALTMAAMVVGTSDEAILQNSLEVAPTLGVNVSVSVAHLYAPIILLFLHVGALIQMDLVGERIGDLQKLLSDPALQDIDRIHHERRIHGFAKLHILANKEPHQATRRLLRAIGWLTIVGIPVLVLLALQIGFLRYQSRGITAVQQLVFLSDAAALVWFHLRLNLRGQYSKPWPLRTNAAFVLVGVLVSAFVAIPPNGSERARDVRWAESYAYATWHGKDTTPRQWDNSFIDGACSVGEPDSSEPYKEVGFFDVYVQPILRGCNLLDIFVCPNLDWNWGCRFLRLSHTKLIAVEMPQELLKQLFSEDRAAETSPTDTCPLRRAGTDGRRDPEVIVTQMWSRLVGLRLRARSFRFADFEDAAMYGIDLINSDLRGANLEGANMQWGWFDHANLAGALFDDTRLEYASFVGADLTGASLREAFLRRSDLTGARLDKAALNRADLTKAMMAGASLIDAKIRSAALVETDLTGSIVDGASLECANLRGAHLTGASLIESDLTSIDAFTAELRGSLMADAVLQKNAISEHQLGAETYAYLRLIGGAADNVDRTTTGVQQAPSTDDIAGAFTALACARDAPHRGETWVAGSMLHWLMLSERADTAWSNHALRVVAREVLNSFSRAIAEHWKRGEEDASARCPGLADLRLNAEMRASLALPLAH